MPSGFLYVLQNHAFGTYVVKIGLTTREPDVRSKELYAGSSGVPVPFHVLVAYSVGDCTLAEKRLHRLLKAYRLNRRREFFRVSPSVAARLAYQTCCTVNRELGISLPTRFAMRREIGHSAPLDAVDETDFDPSDGRPITHIDPRSLRESPVGTSTLDAEQEGRVNVLAMLLARIHPKSYHEWREGFTRDENPEREIRIWEHIAKAYMTVEEPGLASDDVKAEAFHLLIERSWRPSDEVLRMRELKHLSLATAKRLLRAYELRPKPLIVRQGAA